MNISSKNKVLVFFLCLGIMMITAGLFITNKTKAVFDNSVFLTERTHDVIFETQTVLSIIQDIQFSGRGYMITGDSSQLKDLKHSIAILPKAIQKLKMVSPVNSRQVMRIDSVALISESMIKYVNHYTSVRKEKGLAAASVFFNIETSKRYNNNIRHVLNRIQKAEYELLERRRDANQKSTASLYNIFIFLISSQAIFLLIFFFTLRNNIKFKEDKEKAQSLYEAIITSSEDAIVSKNLQGIITSWNHGAENLFGYSPKEILGKHITTIIPESHWSEEDEIISKIKQNKTVVHYDTIRLRRDGSIVPISLTVSSLKDSQGNIIGASKISRNITQRKIDDAVLAKSLKDISDYKYALNESSIVAITDQDGIIKHVNDNFCNISKYSQQALIGQDHHIINSGYHSKEFMDDLWSTISNGKIWKGELKNKAKDGSTYWVDATIVPFLNSQDKPYQYVAINADITGRKKVEEENERNKIVFRKTLDKMLEGVEILGFDFRYIYVNNAYEKQVKHTKEELLGYTVMEKFPNIEKTQIFKSIVRCFDERIPIHLEDKFTFSDNTTTWFEISFQPVPEGVFILSVDITEKKLAQQRINENEERFRSLIENSYDVVSIVDKNFNPVYRSPSAIRVTGYSNDERDLVESNKQIHPDDLASVGKVMKEVLKNPMVPYPLRLRMKHKHGHYILLEGVVTNMFHNSGINGIVANFRDITESQKAEEKLRESEKIYKAVASSIPGSVICLLDKDYRYFLVEGDLIELLGYSKEKLLGKRIEDVITPERVKEVTPLFKRVFNGESFTLEKTLVDIHTIYRYVPLKDDHDKVFAAMIVVLDVSELKKAQSHIIDLNTDLERKITERTLELELVNKELEAFSYSVAHDLRTPLRAVNGYATMLEEDYSQQLDDEGNRLIKAIERNAKRMGTLIDDLLTFSRLGRKGIQKSLIDMNQITTSSLDDIHLHENYHGSIKIKNLLPVMADFTLIKHVMINLLNNAIKYSYKKDRPEIVISSIQENETITYIIKDNGVGFDMLYAHKLFGVFQRLHSDAEFDGTGVGLAIVQRIIHRHGGKVWAEAKVNEGATFYFSLPIITESIKNDLT